MFTGIIETVGEVSGIEREKGNIHFTVTSEISNELKIDQSVAHNGCCLTVIGLEQDCYTVTAIQETLDKTNLNEWKVGTKVNLERCLQIGARLDGHLVQGHIDTTAECVGVQETEGSWKYLFRYTSDYPTVQKGSIAVNGVSLTVVDSEKGLFSVCLIPYTYENTNFKQIEVGSKVNVEFDVIGKYVSRLMEKTL